MIEKQARPSGDKGVPGTPRLVPLLYNQSVWGWCKPFSCPAPPHPIQPLSRANMPSQMGYWKTEGTPALVPTHAATGHDGASLQGMAPMSWLWWSTDANHLGGAESVVQDPGLTPVPKGSRGGQSVWASVRAFNAAGRQASGPAASGSASPAGTGSGAVSATNIGGFFDANGLIW